MVGISFKGNCVMPRDDEITMHRALSSPYSWGKNEIALEKTFVVYGKPWKVLHEISYVYYFVFV